MKGLKQLLLSLCLLCACCAPGYAVESKAVATGSLKEMVYELPSDSGKLYLTVVGAANDSQYKSLCASLNSTEECREVRDQYHYNQLAKGSAMFSARYAKDYKNFPDVRIQTADGNIVQEWSGSEIPSVDELKNCGKAECWGLFKHNREDEKSDTSDETVVKQPVAKEPVSMLEMIPWWIYVLAMLGGVALREVEDLRQKD